MIDEEHYKEFINWLEEQKDISALERFTMQLIAIYSLNKQIFNECEYQLINKRYFELKKKVGDAFLKPCKKE